MRLYKQAARMGAIEAYRRLGTMYFHGEGVNEDFKKALEFWKEGVKKGDNPCYAHMARLFSLDGQFDNAKKCWKRFFISSRAGKDSAENGLYYYLYLSDVNFYKWELDYFEDLKKNKECLQIFLLGYVQRIIKEWPDRVIEIKRAQELLDWAQQL